MQVRSLALCVEAREPLEQPAGTADGIAAVTADVELQGLTALNQHADDLLHTITLEAKLARDGRNQCFAVEAQQGCRTGGAAAHRLRGKQPVQILVGQSAAVMALASELATVMLRQRAGVRLEGL